MEIQFVLQIYLKNRKKFSQFWKIWIVYSANEFGIKAKYNEIIHIRECIEALLSYHWKMCKIQSAVEIVKTAI